MSAQQSFYATGRRKTSSARVHLIPAETEGEGSFVINKREFAEYFPRPIVQKIIAQPLDITEKLGAFDIKVTVRGGGKSGQAGAVRHGVARALLEYDPELRPALKKAGMLTRDPRVVERKKPGRHKARKKPQFSKR